MKGMKWLLAAVLSLALLFAMGSTVFAADDSSTELTITNNTGMFKAITASLTEENGQEYLVMALSGTGYKELFKGTYEMALENGDGTADNGNGSWIHGYTNNEGLLEFKIPLNSDETYVPCVAISNSYYTKYLNGLNPIERAYYPRQFEVDREAKTLVTGDYDETADFTVTSNVYDFRVKKTASTRIVGGPVSNNYTVAPTLMMADSTYDKVTYPTVVSGEVSTEEAALTDGCFAISLANAPQKEAFKDKTPIEMTFHVADTAPYQEAGQDVIRTVTIDKLAKTITIEGTPLNAVLEDGTYILPELKAGPSAMFNHFIDHSKKVVISDDEAKICFTTDGSTASIQKYSKIALGKSSELVTENYQQDLPEGTTVIEGVLQDDGTDAKEYSFEISIPKAEAEALLNNSVEEDIYIIVWNSEGSKEAKIPGWYKASNDMYLSLGHLGEELADYSAVEEAKGKVPEDLSIYTDETRQAVKDALNAVVEGKPVSDQAEVDAMAEAIITAVNGLRVSKFEYDGTEVSFIDKDGNAFGMWAAQEGTACLQKDGKVAITYIPKNTTVYGWIHWGGINEELTKDAALEENGTILLTVDTDMCGWAHPVAPIKKKDGNTTGTQYYLAIPALDNIPVKEVEDAKAAIAEAKADPTNKEKVQAALDAIDKLTDEQKAALADDIQAVNDAKAAIDKAEKEAADQAEAAKIKASAITLKSAKAGKKKITVTWKKNADVAGYQVYYKTGKKAKTVKITKNSTTKKVIKKLKKGKKYTVKVRGYKKINGQMVYTKWSKAKKIKVKK